MKPTHRQRTHTSNQLEVNDYPRSQHTAAKHGISARPSLKWFRSCFQGGVLVVAGFALSGCMILSRAVVENYAVYRTNYTTNPPLFAWKGKYLLYGSIQKTDRENPVACMFEFDLKICDDELGVKPTIHEHVEELVRLEGTPINRYIRTPSSTRSVQEYMHMLNAEECWEYDLTNPEGMLNGQFQLHVQSGEMCQRYTLYAYGYSSIRLYRIPDKIAVFSLAVVGDIITAPLQIFIMWSLRGFG